MWCEWSNWTYLKFNMSGVLVEVIIPIFEVLDVSTGHNTFAFRSRYHPLVGNKKIKNRGSRL
jgi:hypothetical protein